jgi:hypothetical protein
MHGPYKIAEGKSERMTAWERGMAAKGGEYLYQLSN